MQYDPARFLTNLYKFSMIVGIAFVLLFVILFSQRAQADESGAEPNELGSISGRVVDENHNPVSDTLVFLYRYPFYEQQQSYRIVHTNAYGMYTLFTLPTGIYQIEYVDGSKRYGVQFYDDVSRREAATEISLLGNQLTLSDTVLHRTGAISGRVSMTYTVPDNNGISVLLYRPNGDNSWSQVDQQLLQGNMRAFQFNGVTAGIYRICASSDLGDALKFAGCYHDSQATPPFASDKMLRWTVSSMAIPSPAIDGSDIEVRPDEIISNISMKLEYVGTTGPLPKGPGISGRVLSSFGEPLLGISVELLGAFSGLGWGKIAGTYTDIEGNYLLGNPGPNIYGYLVRFTDSSNNYVTEYYQNVYADNYAEILFPKVDERISNIDATLEPAAAISGYVTFADGQVPEVAHFTVYRAENDFWGLQPSIVAYSKGHYTLKGLQPGLYRVQSMTFLDNDQQASVSGFYGGNLLETAKDISLTIGTTQTNVNIVLGEGDFEGVIQGVVTSEHQPQAGIRVELFSDRYEPFFYLFTDAEGKYAISALQNGIYHIRFSDPNLKYAATFSNNQPYLYDSESIIISTASQTATVNMSLTSSGAIHGILKRYDSKPIEDASVILYWYNNTNPNYTSIKELLTIETDIDGAFSFDNLLPGPYRIVFFSSQLSSYVSWGIYDPVQNIYIPGDLIVRSNQITDASMSVEFSTLRPEPVYLPLLLR